MNLTPFYWICCSALMIRSFSLLLGRQLPTRGADYCMRLSFCQFVHGVQSCSQNALHLGTRRRLSTMTSSGWDYAQHNVRCLKDLGLEPMDVIIAGQRREAKEHVVFFGGDVQDYPENMQSHRDNGKYIRWNSVAMAGRLCERFPTAMVLVMKPHHMHLKTFSVYSQFVQSNDFGCPTHSPDFGAWQTLVQVYAEAVGTVLGPARDAPISSRDASVNSNSADSVANSNDSGDSVSGTSLPGQLTCAAPESTSAVDKDVNHHTDKAGNSGVVSHVLDVPLHLVGFSKGCIVLNQLVHELESVEKNERVQKFLSRIRTMHWLDGGHSGGSNTWVTDQAAIERLAAYKIDIHVHVTPYQVKDQMRRWIGKEKRRFVEMLQKSGAKVTDILHFEDEPKSIDNHFRVLEVF